ncbi:hypothetical protein HK100_001541 [Physocladia obscura]|uniref:AB hydrolase-1 domain-containing protein n=1 Tax=Physocladia obscura TaxID=109957 RepID=A0AAD5XEG4_9FUNG|nr:hypothetical protein HK100_001541 [Physocladia obscura]
MASMPPGSRTTVDEPSKFAMQDYASVAMRTVDGVRITGFAIFHRASPSDSPANITLLYCHANAGNMGHRLPLASRIKNLAGVNVFMLSYRGYGLSDGTPSEKGLKIDAQTALDWILNHPELGSTKIIVYGQSIGGAVAIDLAARYKGYQILFRDNLKY